MDKLTHEQIKELEEHRAIKHGGWKLVAHIAMSIVSGAMVIAGVLGIVAVFGSSGVGIGIGSIACAIGIIVWAQWAFNKERLAWLSNYWRRNVCSTSAIIWLKNGIMQFRMHTYQSDDWLPPADNHLYAVLKLGGWRRGKIPNAVMPTTKIGTAIGIGWEIAFLAVDSEHDDVIVRIRNQTGDTMCCGLRQAFALFRIIDALTPRVELAGLPSALLAAFLGAGPITLADAFAVAEREREELGHRLTMLFGDIHAAAGNPPFDPDRAFMDRIEEQVRRLVSERDAAREEVDRYAQGFLPEAVKDRDDARRDADGLSMQVKQLDIDRKLIADQRNAARKEREEAATFIAELDRRFAESSRLHDKLQALRIWERVREWLYFHRFPTAWNTSVPEQDAAKQHDADAGALAEVRARIKVHERRDLRRHGRKLQQEQASANPT